MRRFRPNLVVAVGKAFDEDRWRRIRIGAVELRVVKPCSRCVITTVGREAPGLGQVRVRRRRTMPGSSRSQKQTLIHRAGIDQHADQLGR